MLVVVALKMLMTFVVLCDVDVSHHCEKKGPIFWDLPPNAREDADNRGEGKKNSHTLLQPSVCSCISISGIKDMYTRHTSKQENNDHCAAQEQRVIVMENHTQQAYMYKQQIQLPLLNHAAPAATQSKIGKAVVAASKVSLLLLFFCRAAIVCRLPSRIIMHALHTN